MSNESRPNKGGFFLVMFCNATCVTEYMLCKNLEWP